MPDMSVDAFGDSGVYNPLEHYIAEAAALHAFLDPSAPGPTLDPEVRSRLLKDVSFEELRPSSDTSLVRPVDTKGFTFPPHAAREILNSVGLTEYTLETHTDALNVLGPLLGFHPKVRTIATSIYDVPDDAVGETFWCNPTYTHGLRREGPLVPLHEWGFWAQKVLRAGKKAKKATKGFLVTPVWFVTSNPADLYLLDRRVS